ncbi:MAG: hypothetical protein M3Y81_00175 [Chloroflexota bacterium]|nr:hypothetical protein [Chloroflexota bacterium]
MTDLPRLADLLRSRNTVEARIAALIEQPATIQNVGEHIAAAIFGVALEESAKSRGSDGRFTRGPLADYTVDIQWHIKHDGLLHIRPDSLPDYYLVLAGPKVTASTLRSLANPWAIETVYLFDAHELLNALHERKVQVGTGTSVTGPLWERSEIYPKQVSAQLLLSHEERSLLALFQQA